MNLRTKYIFDWVERRRPDCLEQVKAIHDAPANDNYNALIALMGMAFEAGRHFQHDRPLAELDAPWIYTEVTD